MDDEFERKAKIPLNPKGLSYGDLAKILDKPNKMASLNNSFLAFKKLGGIRLPEFLRARQENYDRID